MKKLIIPFLLSFLASTLVLANEQKECTDDQIAEAYLDAEDAMFSYRFKFEILGCFAVESWGKRTDQKSIDIYRRYQNQKLYCRNARKALETLDDELRVIATEAGGSIDEFVLTCDIAQKITQKHNKFLEQWNTSEFQALDIFKHMREYADAKGEITVEEVLGYFGNDRPYYIYNVAHDRHEKIGNLRSDITIAEVSNKKIMFNLSTMNSNSFHSCSVQGYMEREGEGFVMRKETPSGKTCELRLTKPRGSDVEIEDVGFVCKREMGYCEPRADLNVVLSRMKPKTAQGIRFNFSRDSATANFVVNKINAAVLNKEVLHSDWEIKAADTACVVFKKRANAEKLQALAKAEAASENEKLETTIVDTCLERYPGKK